ncbi:MAG: type II toxin-antitoxin system HipA family toxin [Alphaproteobacteria bacterium]
MDAATLEVRLCGRTVGSLARIAGQYLFAFADAYVADSGRPTLSLSFKGEGGLVTALRPTWTRVPPFFANLLPEGALRDYLARRAGLRPDAEFALLAALGADLPGAVEIVADIAPAALADTAAPLRFSLAGVQLKLSAALRGSGRWTVPTRGVGGEWIVKLPSARFPGLVENEFVVMELARRVGIAVPTVRLVPVAEIEGVPPDMPAVPPGAALAVERFDRVPGGGRIHMEDFAQIFGVYPERKYEGRSYPNIARVLAAEAGPEAVGEMVRRLAFSVLVGNGDMHLKNWSLLYPDGRTPALAPAYDLLATVAYLPDDRLALGFGRERGLAGIARDQIRRFCEAAGAEVDPMWRIVAETAAATVAAWRDHEPRSLLDAGLDSAIDRQIVRASAAIG